MAKMIIISVLVVIGLMAAYAICFGIDLDYVTGVFVGYGVGVYAGIAILKIDRNIL